MDLGIQDVAALLHVTEETIHDWVEKGLMPTYQIKGQMRFNRSQVENWVMSRKMHSRGEAFLFDGAKDHINETDEEPATPSKGGIHQFSLFRALHKGHVFLHVAGNTKEEVIRNTMHHMAHHLNLDAEVLTDLLLDRERLMPTALNNGIAVPHTRDFLLNAHYDVVTIVFPKNRIDYDAFDGQPVHTLFFLFACEDRRHLNLLAKIAHFGSRPEALQFLQTQPDKMELLKYIQNWESHLSQTC